MTGPKILVLLACRNGEEWLEAQIQSVLGQRGVETRVLAGDDASSDATVAIVGSFQRLGRVELRTWAEASGSAGANFRRLFREAESSDYEFVALADQDDIWHPDKLAVAVQCLQTSGAAGYSCAVQAFWMDGRERTVRQSGKVRAADFLFEGGGQGCTFVLRRELFERVRLFCMEHSRHAEALHYHDWLVYLLARVWRSEWYFDPRPWIRYRQHQKNEIGSRGGFCAFAARLVRIRDGWYLGQIRAALEVANAAGEAGPATRRLALLLATPDSLRRRLSMSAFTLLRGRRRLADRLVLAISGLVGWI